MRGRLLAVSCANAISGYSARRRFRRRHRSRPGCPLRRRTLCRSQTPTATRAPRIAGERWESECRSDLSLSLTSATLAIPSRRSVPMRHSDVSAHPPTPGRGRPDSGSWRHVRSSRRVFQSSDRGAARADEIRRDIPASSERSRQTFGGIGGISTFPTPAVFASRSASRSRGGNRQRHDRRAQPLFIFRP